MYTGTLVEFLNMGGGEIMLIMAVILLLFGGKKLPELARGLGKGIRDFKDASEGVKREIHRNINALDLDEELKDEKPYEPGKSQTELLAEQMYPTTPHESIPIAQEPIHVPEEKVAINLNKDTAPAEHTDIAAPVSHETPAEKLEKDKIN